MKIAITGATGFIGRHLAARLVEGGVETLAVVRPQSTHPAPPGTRVISLALDNPRLADALSGVDAIVHLAAVVSAVRPEEYASINVGGARSVAAAARATGARMIHISSLAAAGPAPVSKPKREDDDARPLTAYGRSKLEGEEAVRSTRGLRWTILRPAAVYGPGDRAMLPLFRMAQKGFLPVVGRRDAAYTFVHVADVVRAINAAITGQADGEVVFVGHPQPATAVQIAEAIRAALNPHARLIRVPGPILRAAGNAGDFVSRALGRPMALNRARLLELSAEGFVCSVDRLRDRLGVVAEIGLPEGLAETAAWYRRQKWL